MCKITWKESPEKEGKGSRKEKILLRELKRSPGSARAAAGVCVTNIVGGVGEKDPQRREEEVLERRKV